MNEAQQEQTAPQAETHDYETSDIQPRYIAIFLAALTAMVLSVMGILALWYGGPRLEDPDAGPVMREEGLGVPHLQAAPAKELLQLRQKHRQQLRGYAWQDKEAKQVRIPIDRAMEIVAREGLPQWGAGGGAIEFPTPPPAEGAPPEPPSSQQE